MIIRVLFYVESFCTCHDTLIMVYADMGDI